VTIAVKLFLTVMKWDEHPWQNLVRIYATLSIVVVLIYSPRTMTSREVSLSLSRYIKSRKFQES